MLIYISFTRLQNSQKQFSFTKDSLNLIQFVVVSWHLVTLSIATIRWGSNITFRSLTFAMPRGKYWKPEFKHFPRDLANVDQWQNHVWSLLLHKFNRRNRFHKINMLDSGLGLEIIILARALRSGDTRLLNTPVSLLFLSRVYQTIVLKVCDSIPAALQARKCLLSKR